MFSHTSTGSILRHHGKCIFKVERVFVQLGQLLIEEKQDQKPGNEETIRNCFCRKLTPITMQITFICVSIK